MDTISMDAFWKELAGYDTRLVIAGVIGILVFIAEMILANKGVLFAGGDKRFARAQKNGHIVVAHLISCRYDYRESSGGAGDNVWVGAYEYEVGGYRGKKVIHSSTGRPAQTVTLYYDKNPRKAYTENEMRKPPSTMLIVIIPVIASVVVAKLLGYGS